jgi:hypothetical protein
MSKRAANDCPHTFVPADDAFLDEWMRRIRTQYEPECPRCADAYPQRPGEDTPLVSKRCAQCKKAFAAYRERVSARSARARMFCNAACQRSFHASTTGDDGLLSTRALTIGMLVFGPATPDQPLPRTRGEVESEFLFVHGDDKLLRTHMAQLSAMENTVLPLYASLSELFTGADTISLSCGDDEVGIHYALAKGVSPERAGGSGASSVVYTSLWQDRPRPFGATSNALFAKFAKAEVLDKTVVDLYASLVGLYDNVVLHSSRPVASVLNQADLDVLVGELYNEVRVEDGTKTVIPADEIGEEAVLVVVADLVARLLAEHTTIAGQWVAAVMTQHLGVPPGATARESVLDAVQVWRFSKAHRHTPNPHAYTSPYASTYNHENFNEIATGMRVSSMFYAGISPGFTPLVDYFICKEGADVKVYTFNEVNTDKSDVFMEQAATIDSLVLQLRSFFAQVLLALEAAQFHLAFVHRDLHTGNVMALELPAAYIGSTLQFRRPGENGDMFIPADDSHLYLARIIDYGRSRANNPSNAGDPALASGIIRDFMDKEFDPWVDMRALAYHVARALKRNGLLAELSNAAAERHEGAALLIDLMDQLVGTKTWDAGALQQKHADLPLGSWVVGQTSLLDFFEMVEDVYAFYDPREGAFYDPLEVFRVAQIFTTRPEQVRDGTAPTPGTFLTQHALFEPYRTAVPGPYDRVDFIGDATLPLVAA